jgi:hypothetical protein
LVRQGFLAVPDEFLLGFLLDGFAVKLVLIGGVDNFGDAAGSFIDVLALDDEAQVLLALQALVVLLVGGLRQGGALPRRLHFRLLGGLRQEALDLELGGQEGLRGDVVVVPVLANRDRDVDADLGCEVSLVL